MKNLKPLLLIPALILSIMVIGQNEKKPLFKVTSTGFNFGFAGVGTASTTEDYNNLAGAVVDPSYFINADDYKTSSYNFGFGGNVNPKIYLGLTPYSKKKGEYRYDRELRISVGSSAGIRRNFNYYQYDNFTIDTLISPSTGNVAYVDSSKYNRYVYSENFFDFNFGISFLFKTDLKRRVHFSVGAGFEYAYAFRSYVSIENYNENSVYYYDPNNKPEFDEFENGYEFYDYKNGFEGTTSNNSTNLSGSLQFARILLPFGVNFRISNKTQSFFNKVYLFSEMSPGIEFQIVGNDKTYTNPYFGIAMLGFSYRW